MLRRHLPLADNPERWLLVSQIEHARLSFDLARVWGNDQFPPVLAGDHPLRDEWLRAVYHHDDGWGSSEADPPLDPVEGRPYSFLDLPREESLVLWRDSIHLARREGPFAAWCVARHFMALLESSDDVALPAAQQWLAEMESHCQGWLEEWRPSTTATADEVAARSLHGLQWFDWLSLWFSLECPGTTDDRAAEPCVAETTWGAPREVAFVPASTQSRGTPRQVVVRPWPFAVESLDLEVLGYALPVRHYRAHDELIERRMPLSLAWHLVPAN